MHNTIPMGWVCVVIGLTVCLRDIWNVLSGQPPIQPVGFGILLMTVGAIAIRVSEQ